jgi:CRP-like cAMP-binding protein
MESPLRAWEARELSVRLREPASYAPLRERWSRRLGSRSRTSAAGRLLLVLSEQSKGDTILFSQDRLADMLGLRRSSVTLAAQTLQSRRLIRYRRGRIEIVNRKELKATACECYEVVSRTFDQFLEGI